MESVYDCALTEVGHEGNFQRRFDVIYNMVLVSLWAMAYMNLYLVLVIIPHTCHVPKRPDNASEYEWKSKYIPKFEDSTGQMRFNSCSIYVNLDKVNETKACNKFDYDRTWYNSTIPSENDWVCGNELLIANVFAYCRIGEIIGSAFFGWFADLYGRRPTYIISLILMTFGRFMSILTANSFTLFVIGCVISWFPSWSVVQTATVISLEISSAARRTTTTSFRFAAFSFGTCIMPFIYWWLRDWKPFLTVTTVLHLPFVIFSWKIIESPRWLWVEGKSKECVKQLKRIAKVNKTKLKLDTEKELLTTPPTTIKQVQAFGPLSLFSGWRIAFNTILQLILCVIVTMNYTVLLINSGEKPDGNPFLEFAWQSLAEIPGNFIGAWLADSVGRRYTGVTSFGTTALMWTIMVVRDSSTNIWIQGSWIGSALSIINRFSTTVAYYVINLFSMELYPTCLRQSGMSLGNLFSSGAAAFTPYLIYLGRRVDTRLPSSVLIIISLLGVAFSLLLPETLNAKLPETLEDAKTYGKVKHGRDIHVEKQHNTEESMPMTELK